MSQSRDQIRQEMKIENLANVMEFIANRADNVAMWVVDWMPPEDNEKHHNAIEHLRRIHETAMYVKTELFKIVGVDDVHTSVWKDPVTGVPKGS